MTGLGYMLAAMAIGMMVAAQPPMNAILSQAVGHPLAATAIQIFVAFCLAVLLLMAIARGSVTLGGALTVPWWVWLAGVIGVIYVASGVMIAPVTGALLYFVCIVAGQLLGAMAMDHFGAFGLQVREVSVLRVGGFALVLTGALMVLHG
jgi:transporter family-2 protein